VSWSHVVADLSDAQALAAAERAGALDLRATAPGPGSHEVVPGEHARPLLQQLPDAAAARALGARLAADLRPGDVVVLTGPLGAGKTTLTQGLGEALGVRGRVTSPTFVLARAHRGPVPLLHVDAYRLRDAAAAGRPLDLDDLGLDTALDDAVTVVEWGEGLLEAVVPSRLHVVLGRAVGAAEVPAAGDGPRTALVRAVGPRWAQIRGA
jgi:tRNA threonylcarbamoyl adenosine modification protein YjeE